LTPIDAEWTATGSVNQRFSLFRNESEPFLELESAASTANLLR
jgi:hypothetical protein